MAATGLALRTHSWGFLGVHGVSNAVGTRVSNELGAGNHGVATLAVQVSQGSGWFDADRPPVCCPLVLPVPPFPVVLPVPPSLNGFAAGDSATLQAQRGELCRPWGPRGRHYITDQHLCRWG